MQVIPSTRTRVRLSRLRRSRHRPLGNSGYAGRVLHPARLPDPSVTRIRRLISALLPPACDATTTSRAPAEDALCRRSERLPPCGEHLQDLRHAYLRDLAGQSRAACLTNPSLTFEGVPRRRKRPRYPTSPGSRSPPSLRPIFSRISRISIQHRLWPQYFLVCCRSRQANACRQRPRSHCFRSRPSQCQMTSTTTNANSAV